MRHTEGARPVDARTHGEMPGTVLLQGREVPRCEQARDPREALCRQDGGASDAASEGSARDESGQEVHCEGRAEIAVVQGHQVAEGATETAVAVTDNVAASVAATLAAAKAVAGAAASAWQQRERRRRAGRLAADSLSSVHRPKLAESSHRAACRNWNASEHRYRVPAATTSSGGSSGGFGNSSRHGGGWARSHGDRRPL
mmetsp:Transcript_81505/g.174645  ORF Transcript_81505/g.174645 Transcript_81505/m.174645 type:complete len:200 (-) Transcript_81505:475-1074(-)